mgnify:CR=1 FL=1|jgi:hypothetical protein
MNNTLDTIIDNLIKDTVFKKNVSDTITKVMKDGKIDHKDLPDIIFLVIDSYNKLNSKKLSTNDIPEFIRRVVKIILDEKNLIHDNQEEMFLNMVEIAIKLVMIQPKVKKCCKLLPCF